MTLNRTTLTALALIGAALAVLVAMFAPLPRAVLSEEEHAEGRMPETRQRVEEARAQFDLAARSYRDYVGANDVGAALNAIDRAAAALKESENSPTARQAVRDAAEPLITYMERLEAYAISGEAYFDALRHYDDELMAWTRSLGAESEVLRPATWPIVEYLKLYPPPTGLATDYRTLPPTALRDLNGELEVHAQNGSAGELQTDADAVRQAGRSVEYIEGLHPQYETLLRDYDGKLQSVVASRGSAEPDARRALSTALDVAVALLLGLGIAGLLLPRRALPGGDT